MWICLLEKSFCLSEMSFDQKIGRNPSSTATENRQKWRILSKIFKKVPDMSGGCQNRPVQLTEILNIPKFSVWQIRKNARSHAWIAWSDPTLKSTQGPSRKSWVRKRTRFDSSHSLKVCNSLQNLVVTIPGGHQSNPTQIKKEIILSLSEVFYEKESPKVWRDELQRVPDFACRIFSFRALQIRHVWFFNSLVSTKPCLA